MLEDMKTEIKLKNGTICTIRTLMKSDAEEYMKCMIKVMCETEYDTYYTDELTTELSKYESFLEEKRNNVYCIMLGAFQDNTLMGSISIDPCGYCSKLKHKASLSLMVKEEYSNNGVGYYLSKEALKYAKELYTVIMLDVVKENVKAIHLYKKLGFKEYGIFEKYFRKRTGEYQDNILMRLDFDEELRLNY